MSSHYQEFSLYKINDYNRAQKRKLQLRDKSLIAMKGSKIKREVLYKDIDGVTFNIAGKRMEFVFHNNTGDLRYRCKKEDQRRIILMHFLDHVKETHNFVIKDRFYCVRLDDLKAYQNTKKDYEENHTIRIPKDYECDPDYLEDNDYLVGVANHMSKEHLNSIKSRRTKRLSDSSDEDFKYNNTSHSFESSSTVQILPARTSDRLGGTDDSEEEEDYKRLLTLDRLHKPRPIFTDVFDESNGEHSGRLSSDIP